MKSVKNSSGLDARMAVPPFPKNDLKFSDHNYERFMVSVRVPSKFK